MRFFNNIVFWKKLVMISLIPLLIISIVIGMLSYKRASLAAQDSSKNNINDAINRIDMTITLRTRQLDNTVEIIASSMELSDFMADGRKIEELSEFCTKMTEPFQEITSLSVLLGSECVYSTLGERTPDPELVEKLYIPAAQHPEKALWSEMSGRLFQEYQSTNSPTILVSHGLKDETGEVAGLLVLEINANFFGNIILNKQKINENQINFLVDGGRNVVYCENALPEGFVDDAMHLYQQGKRVFAFEFGDDTYFCCAQYNGMVGWITFICIEWHALFPGSNILRNYIAILVIICFFVACVLLMILSQMITKPLQALNEAMKQVQDTNFEIRLENDRSDEIGELTDSFNYMVDQIRTLVNRVYREQLAQKNAEMEALQAQINPHFLYNSLDSINWMLIDRGELDISNVVVALGKLMQYSMDSRKSLVPLREEYRNAKDYLIIQRNRLEDQLDYELDLDEGLEEFCVPKLILQPLIENAIKHGVLESLHRCRVVVKTCRVGDRICITISDNGAGMTEEKLETYRQLLNGTSREQENIGTRNVARRLQLHFKEQCEFTVTSTVGQGTTISLQLPIITNGGDNFENYHH